MPSHLRSMAPLGTLYRIHRYRGHCQLLRPWDADVVRAPPNNPYRGHRFSGEIISQVVWLYFRFSVSYRGVEEMMAMRGVQLTYEASRDHSGNFVR